MGKRRVEQEDSDIDVSSTDEETELEQQEGEQPQEEEEIVDVDFDYFDLNPDVDFHATKTFIRQLLGDDANSFDISSLANLILEENSVGTTIKTDGKESDPFALLSVINLNDNLQKPSIKQLCDYLLKKTSKNLEFNIMLKKLLAPASTTKSTAKSLKVGLIVSDRMINMPVEVVPPMYKMLLEEMAKSEDAHEKYEVDYFLVISKIYHLVAANETFEEDEKKKAATNKKKKLTAAKEVEMDYFHYEDLVLEANCLYKGYYEYDNKKQETDSRRVFTEYGIDPKLSLILLDRESLVKSVPEMEEKFPPF